MKFRSKVVEIEANQFLRRSECPLGVRTREDGSHYVVTIHGQETDIELCDWIIIEPGSDGTLAYPCKPDIFAQRYEPIEEEKKNWVETPDSSNIVGFGYEASTMILTVEFKGGGRYQYEGVDQPVFDDFKESKSKGSFFAKNVKEVFRCRRI